VIMGAKFRPLVLQSLTTIISFPSLNRKGTLTPKGEPVTYSIVFIVDSRSFLLTPFTGYSLDPSPLPSFTSPSYIRVAS
jgi:hypothetical protein